MTEIKIAQNVEKLMSQVDDISKLLAQLVPSGDIVLNQTQSAKYLGLTRQTIITYIKRGILKETCDNGVKGIALKDLNALKLYTLHKYEMDKPL